MELAMSGTDLEVLQPFDNQHQARPSCTVSGPKRKMTAGADTTYPMAKWPNLQRYANPHAEQQIITPHVKSQKGLPPKNKPDSDATTTKQSTAMDEVRGCPKSLEFIDDIINIDHSEQKVANYLGCRDSTQAFRNLLLIFKGYTKHRAFELIRDREEAMLALIQERLEADYPITDIARSEDVGQKRRKKVRQDPVNRSYHITSLLLNLEKDLESLCTLSGAQFAALQVEEEIAFGRALPELRIPHNTLKHIENAILPTLSFHFELRRRRTPAREHQWLLGPTEVYEVPEGSRRVLDDEVQCGWLAEAY